MAAWVHGYGDTTGHAEITSATVLRLHSGMGKRQEDSSRRGDYWSGAHTRHRLRFHLVWIPKYRRRVMEGKLAARIEQLFRQACEVHDWQMHELSVQPDHVHLLLQIHPRQSVSKVVGLLKGGSSRALRKEFPELEEFLWDKHFWADGYFAESVGQTEEGIVRRYIKEQRQQPQRPADSEKETGTW